MSNDTPPRWPHLIGKGILYSGDQMSKHEQLIRDLWALVDRLNEQYAEHDYGEPIDHRASIAEELEALLEKVGEKRERRMQK